jgi:hypothetical protein
MASALSAQQVVEKQLTSVFLRTCGKGEVTGKKKKSPVINQLSNLNANSGCYKQQGWAFS